MRIAYEAEFQQYGRLMIFPDYVIIAKAHAPVSQSDLFLQGIMNMVGKRFLINMVIIACYSAGICGSVAVIVNTDKSIGFVNTGKIDPRRQGNKNIAVAGKNDARPFSPQASISRAA